MSLVGGFNHNIKHRGQVFHVQTEDTGDGSAVVVTHLFLGGTIVATRRASWAELRGAPDLQQRVRFRMEEQHKAVLRDLVNGKFDQKIEGLTAYQPGQLALRESAGPAGAVAPVHRAPPPPPPAENRAAANTTLFDIDVVFDDDDEEEGEANRFEPGAQANPPPGGATLFDRAPAQGQATRFGNGGAASGRATLFDNGVVGGGPAGKATLFDGGVVGGGPQQAAKPQRPWPPQPRPPITPGPVATLQPSFGEELISEKSLDEVILAYLAGDGDED